MHRPRTPKERRRCGGKCRQYGSNQTLSQSLKKSVTNGTEGTGSVSCNSVFVLHLCHFLNQEDLMEREAMVQNP